VTWRKVTSGGRQAPTVAWLGQPSPARGPRDDGKVPPRRARRQPPAFALRAVPLPVPVPTGSATAHSDWTLDYPRRPAFKLARKPRQGPWVLTQGKTRSSLIAIALATRGAMVGRVRCDSGIGHGDGASSLGSCTELGGAAAGMLRSGPDRPIEPGIEPGPGASTPAMLRLGLPAPVAPAAAASSGPGLRARQRAHGGQRPSGRWLRPSLHWAFGRPGGPGGAHGASGPGPARWQAGCAGNFSNIRDQPRGGAAPGGHAGECRLPRFQPRSRCDWPWSPETVMLVYEHVMPTTLVDWTRLYRDRGLRRTGEYHQSDPVESANPKRKYLRRFRD
jgi:hypothetical protein